MQNRKIKLGRRILVIAAAGAALLAGLYAPPAQAANIAVTNVKMNYPGTGAGQRFVKFDMSWDASWRASWTETNVTPNVMLTNWDAAWIFMKYRRTAGADTNWHHASLGTNAGDHVAPAGSTISIGLSANAGGTNFGAGVFLYRSGNGHGSWTNTGVQLRWQYADDGVVNGDRVDVCVQAIEMVHVPQGSFYLGDGCTGGVGTEIRGQFEDGTNGTPFLVTNGNYIIYLGGGTNGNLGNHNGEGMAGNNVDDFNDTTTKELPAAFPKGYNAFYCMKYEISQGQYTDFLNMLTRTQATTRQIHLEANYTTFRGTIGTNAFGVYICGAPTRACNWLISGDVWAYADWAGLRPITELEYEKACRGPLYPVSNEYAWGTTVITPQTGYVGIDGSGTETADPPGANCYPGVWTGPNRCGIYATASSGRQSAGASYWGIMELSGNVSVVLMPLWHPNCRGFTGVPGNGSLNSTGDYDAPWTIASGVRGGNYDSSLPCPGFRVSDRISAANWGTWRTRGEGGIAVRSAP